MGNLILCHSKKAEQPFVITRIQRRIYTIEELCYYLCKNLYLVDHTIMNERLCEWLDKELWLSELAENLQALMQEENAIEQFVIRVLEFSKIYSESELMHVQNVLEKFKTQNYIERQKYKADNLMESGEMEAAILVYQSILYMDRDDSMEKAFYGKIYGNLGTAYGRSLLYQEAANMYEKGYELYPDTAMIKKYLYACSMYMSEEQYHGLLTKNEIFLKTDDVLAEEKAEHLNQLQPSSFSTQLSEWKRKYRKP